jgi:hypothetical protein
MHTRLAAAAHTVGFVLLLEHGQEVLDAVDHAPEVDRHQPLDVGERNLLDIAEKYDASIINQDIGTPMPVNHATSEHLDLLCVGHINQVRGDLEGLACEASRDLIKPALINSGEGQTSALARQRFAEGTSYSCGSTRDNGDALMVPVANDDSFVDALFSATR